MLKKIYYYCYYCYYVILTHVDVAGGFTRLIPVQTQWTLVYQADVFSTTPHFFRYLTHFLGSLLFLGDRSFGEVELNN